MSSAADVTGCDPDSVLTCTETAVAGLVAVGVGAVMTLEAEADVGQQFVRREQLGSFADPVVIVVGPQQQTLEERIPAVDRWPALAADRVAGQLCERIGRAGHASNRAASDQVSAARNHAVAVAIQSQEGDIRGRFRPRGLLQISIRVDVEPHAVVHRRQRERIVSIHRQHEDAVRGSCRIRDRRRQVRVNGFLPQEGRLVWRYWLRATVGESILGHEEHEDDQDQSKGSASHAGAHAAPILRRSRVGAGRALSLENGGSTASAGRPTGSASPVHPGHRTGGALALLRRRAGGSRLRW